jgi:hypothetical protein
LAGSRIKRGEGKNLKILKIMWYKLTIEAKASTVKAPLFIAGVFGLHGVARARPLVP